MSNKLKSWGWTPENENNWENIDRRAGDLPGRIIREHRGAYRVVSPEGVTNATLSGSYRHKLTRRGDYPTVGDWVICTVKEGNTIIRDTLPRKTVFSRKTAGTETEEQIMGTNIDKVLIVFAMDGGRTFSARGLERYLTLAWESGAEPLVVLNKLDLCEDIIPFLSAAEEAAPGVPLFLVSAEEKTGVEELREKMVPGETVVLIGPSGVGKSSLINALSGDHLQKVGERREADRRGRHTTTHRELFLLPSGLLLLDSPGLREIQLWGSAETTDEVFSEISELAENCRFRDCTHTSEPGCAVQAALGAGEISLDRFSNYLELRKELAYLQRKEDDRAARQENLKWKKIAQFQKELNKNRKRR